LIGGLAAAGGGGDSDGRGGGVGRVTGGRKCALGGWRRRRDREVRELVAFVGVGGIDAAAHPGGELVGGVGDGGRPGDRCARAPVLKHRPGGAVVDPPFELLGSVAAAGGRGEADGGAG